MILDTRPYLGLESGFSCRFVAETKDSIQRLSVGSLIRARLSINDIQMFAALVEGLEVVSGIISRYAAVESLYLQRSSSVKPLLKDAVTATYASVLAFLSKCRRKFGLGLTGRLARSVIQTPENSVNVQLKVIACNDEKVSRLTEILDAEILRSIEIGQSSMNTEISNMSSDLQALRVGSTDSILKIETLIKSSEGPLIRRMVDLSISSEGLVESRNISQSRQERQEILRWLSTVQYKIHHRGLSKDLSEGTGSWLLQKPQYLERRDSSVSSVLWLHGIRK